MYTVQCTMVHRTVYTVYGVQCTVGQVVYKCFVYCFLCSTPIFFLSTPLYPTQHYTILAGDWAIDCSLDYSGWTVFYPWSTGYGLPRIYVCAYVSLYYPIPVVVVIIIIIMISVADLTYTSQVEAITIRRAKKELSGISTSTYM